MAKAKGPRRGKSKDAGRRTKKKVSILQTEKIEYVDWKDTTLLRRFMSERAKIRARRVTGNTAQQQKLVADAIKVAREMALVPYSNRVTTQRTSKGDRDRQGRAEGPMPRPSAPPPPRRDDGSDEQAAAGGVGDDGTGADTVELDGDGPVGSAETTGGAVDPSETELTEVSES